MKAWLKGGLGGLVIWIIFVILEIIFNPLYHCPKDALCDPGPPSDFFYYLILIALVLIGAFIGWIIGKIKSRA